MCCEKRCDLFSDVIQFISAASPCWMALMSLSTFVKGVMEVSIPVMVCNY